MSEIEEQLREYAADNGYSHLDYSDVMLMGADRIAELERQLAEHGEAVGEVRQDGGYNYLAGFDFHKCNSLPVGTKLYTGPQVPEWQPIETAPKNGIRILLAVDHGEWGDKIWTGMWADGWYLSYGKARTEPTHWMLLPAAPQSGGKP